MGPMDHSEMPKGWSSMAGFVPALRQRLRPWGEVRFGATESDGRLSGVRFFRSEAFVGATGSGVGLAGLTGLVCRLIKIVIPGAAQTRNPCPVGRGWIPTVAGMTIRSGVPCQRAFFYRVVLSIIRHSRLRFWRLTRQCHDQSRARKNADADPIFQTGFRYRPGRQGIRPDAPEVS